MLNKFHSIVLIGLFSLTGLLCVSSEEPLSLNRAKAALHDGFYDKAITELNALQADPELSEKNQNEITMLLAQCYFEKEEFVLCSDLLAANESLKKNAAHRAAYSFLSAASLMAQERLSDARGFLKIDVKKDHPYFIPLKRLEARYHILQRDYKSAIKVYNKTFGEKVSYTKSPEGLLDWAAILIIGDEYESAEVLLSQLNEETNEPGIRQQALYWLSKLKIDQGLYDEAIPILNRLLSMEALPNSLAGNIWINLGQVYSKQGSYSNAIEAISRGEELVTDEEIKESAAVQKALLLVEIKEYDKSHSVLSELIASKGPTPALGEAQLSLAEACLKIKDFTKAAQYFDQYLDVFTDPAGRGQAFYGQGLCHFGNNQFAKAAESFEKADRLIEDQFNSREILIKHADALFRAGDYSLSREKYLEYAQTYAGDKLQNQSRFQAAVCLVKLSQYEEAGEELEVLIAQNEGSSIAERSMIQLAQNQEFMRDFDKAISIYHDYKSEYPDGEYQEMASLYLGLCQYRAIQFAEAEKSFTTIVQTTKDQGLLEQALYLQGWAIYLQGREEETRVMFDKFLAEHPESPWAEHVLFWQAEKEYNKENYSSAEKKFSLLSEKFTSGELRPKALYWAGMSANLDKNYLVAIKHFKEVVENYSSFPQLLECLFYQGDALTSLGEFAGAILVFDQIIKDYPSSYLNCEAYGRKGDCQFALGDKDASRFDEALKSYRRILEQDACSADNVLLAMYKTSRVIQRMGEADKALDKYLDVIYFAKEHEDDLSTASTIWFTRAVFAAGDLLEEKGAWEESIKVYNYLSNSGLVAAKEAQKRIQKIKMEELK